MAVDIKTGLGADYTSANSGMKVLAFDGNANSVHWLPANFLTSSKGYACRRWSTISGNPIGEACENIDYLRDLPSLLGLGCYLVSNTRERRKLNPNNHYQFADGSTAALDGSKGDYMWCWNAHYYACWYEVTYMYEAVSLTPIIGRNNYYIPEGGTSALGIGVMDRTNNLLVSVVNSSTQYRGGNNDAAKDSLYTTQLGMGATNLTPVQFGTYARAKGAGWEAYWYIHDAVVGYLTRIILGTRNIQTAYNATKDANGLYQGGLGAGVSSMPDWGGFNGNYPVVPTSAGIELGDNCGVSNYAVKNGSGTTVYTAPVPCFFGLKNFYGHISRWKRGMIVNKLSSGAGDVYVQPNMFPAFDASTITGKTKAATVPANSPAGWLYISKMSMEYLAAMPTEAVGTSSTYYCDGFYNDNASSGLRCPYCGGNADYGDTVGVGCVAVHLDFSAASAGVSSPLCYLKNETSIVPTMYTD